MLKNLLEVLLGSNQQELNDEDEKIALAALCVRVAKSDNVYDPNEISSIDTEIGRAHVRTPVTEKSRMPSSA